MFAIFTLSRETCTKFWNFSIAKLLLDAGADVNAQVTDKSTSTALKVVCSLVAPNIDLVELLVESGAQLVIPGEKVTVLAIATVNGHMNIVQYLIYSVQGLQWMHQMKVV